jgi:hypothetical protein
LKKKNAFSSRTKGVVFSNRGIMKQYMFDTNIFNHIIDKSIAIEDFSKNAEFFVTHQQEDEIINTKDKVLLC